LKQAENPELPRLFPLSDGDCFALALDFLIKSSGLAGSICRLTLHLEGKLERERLEAAVKRSVLIEWLGHLHYAQRRPAGIFKRFSYDSEAAVTIALHRNESASRDSHEIVTTPGLEVGRAPGLTFDLLDNHDGSTSVVLTWHHILMDALGAELLFQHLNRLSSPGGGDADTLQSLARPSRPVPFHRFLLRLPRKALLARRAIRFVATQCRPPIVSFTRSSTHPASPRNGTPHFCYDNATTARINAHAERIGAALHRGLFFLAATIRAFEAITRNRSQADGAYVVPIPQDLRRRGAWGPILGNRHTFHFYRIEREQAGSLKEIFRLLKQQMVMQLRDGTPLHYEEMMGLLRYLPVSLYARVLQGPTKGQVSSFFYTYTGDSGPTMESFLGVPVQGIRHLPPVADPPGAAVVFSRHRNRVCVSLSLLEGCLTDVELASFRENLRSELLGECER
jgi:hypothetical protein